MDIQFILKELRVSPTELEKLPPMTPGNKERSEKLPVPFSLYGEVLLREFDALQKLADYIESHEQKFGKLFEMLGIVAQDARTLAIIAQELKNNAVTVVTEAVITPKWDLLNRNNLLKILTKYGIEGEITTNEQFAQIVPDIEMLFPQWMSFDHGFTTGIEVVNMVIRGGEVATREVEIRHVDGDAVLEAAGLEYSDLYNFVFLLDPLLVPRVLLALRTGVTHYDQLEYLTATQLAEQIAALKEELSSQDGKEPVILNENVENNTVETTGEKTPENPLVQKTEELTSTPTANSPKPARKKRTAKKD